MFFKRFHHSITLTEKIWFFQQFLKLTKIGFGILESLHFIQQSISHHTMQDIIFQLRKQLQSGLSFSEAAKQHPKLFDTLCCQLIYIGEESGQLACVFHHFIVFQQQWLHLKTQIKKTIRYPLFLLMTAFILCWMMFAYLIPEFKLVFAYHNDALPMMTQLLFHCSDFINSHQLTIFLVTVMSISFFFLFKNKLESLYQRYSWYIPIIRVFHIQLFEIRFTQYLHLLLSSGIPLFESIQLIKQNNTHPFEHAIFNTLCYSLHEGAEFSQAILSIPYFSPLLKQSLQANPHGSTLTESLNEHAEQLQHHLFEQLTHSKEWLEPLIMLVVGALIGIIVIAIYMPIFKLGTVLS